MKIAIIHHEQKIYTGAHYINGLISRKLKREGVEVNNFYPKARILDTPPHLKGLNNILFFYSLLEKRNELLKNDIIQGTTYTPLAFLAFHRPVIAHFGSTTAGFLEASPRTNLLEKELKQFWLDLRRQGVIAELNIKSRRPLRDIVEIEIYTAKKATAVIAASKSVKSELEAAGVKPGKIFVVHNAIEDFWFERSQDGRRELNDPRLIYLGRIGGNVFTYKLKGLDRLWFVYNSMKNVPKITIAMTPNKKITRWFHSSFSNHVLYANLFKEKIKEVLRANRGSILLLPSRYEGFSLSLIEGMSQGLVPLTFPVGVAPEIIKNGKNGFIVDSHKEMAEVAKNLLSDHQLRLELAEAAQQTVSLFREDKMIDNLLKIYESLI